MTIADVYQDAMDTHDSYANALATQAEAQKQVMSLTGQVVEREIAVKAALMAANQGEIPGSNADKRRAAIAVAEQDDEKLVKLKEDLATAQMDIYPADAYVKADYMKLQIMRAYMSALGALGT